MKFLPQTNHINIMKVSLPHIHHRSKAADESDFHTMIRNLAQNTLVDFNLGGFRSKRDLQLLEKAIEKYFQCLATDEHSVLERIKITGSNLPRFALAPILQQIVPSVLQKSAHVKRLELNIETWIPKPTLIRLVSSCNVLESLTLRSVSIRTRCVSDIRHNRGSCGDDDLEDSSVIQIIPYIAQSVTKLNLIDCDIQSYDIPRLCDCLRKRQSLKVLNLRLNRDINDGWEELFSLNVPSLNLSLCDLDSAKGQCMTKCLRDSRSVIKGLFLSGNYRMAPVIPDLVQVVSVSGLLELDISFCDIDNLGQTKLFSILANTDNCQLRSLKMQGSVIGDTEALVNCIYKNTPLQRLILNDPNNQSNVMDSISLKKVLQAVKDNYFLQVFQVNVRKKDRQSVLKEMEFWLQLNRCGRRILFEGSLNNQEIDTKPWHCVLRDAVETDDVEILYWLVKHGASLL